MFSIDDDGDDEDVPIALALFVSSASDNAASLVRSRISLTFEASLPYSFRIRLLNPNQTRNQPFMTTSQ